MCYPLDFGLMFGEHHHIFCINLLVIGFLTISVLILSLICCCPCTSYKICSQICSNKSLDEIVVEKAKKEKGKKGKESLLRKFKLKYKKLQSKRLPNKKMDEKIQLLL